MLFSNKYSRTHILDRTRIHGVKHICSYFMYCHFVCAKFCWIWVSLTSLLALASGFIKMDYERTDPELYLLCKESLIIPVVHKLLTFAFRARQWNHEMRLAYAYKPNRISGEEMRYDGQVRIVYIASLRLVWSFFHCLLQSNVPSDLSQALVCVDGGEWTQQSYERSPVAALEVAAMNLVTSLLQHSDSIGLPSGFPARLSYEASKLHHLGRSLESVALQIGATIFEVNS